MIKHLTRDLTFTRCRVIIIPVRRRWDLEDDAVSRIKLQNIMTSADICQEESEDALG
jgi:hypothetical protein